MRKINTALWLTVLTLATTSCLKEGESELDRIIERDNAILEEYISSNDIDAERTQVGYYYKKDLELDNAPSISNNDAIGIYYEIRTFDGNLIDSNIDEPESPVIFRFGENGIWPGAIAYAAGLARVGEELTLYVPSYLGYGNYAYQQQILPNSNLVVKVKYAKKYSDEELKEVEDHLILRYIEENNHEGFERKDNGIYVKVIEEGEEGEGSKNGDNITFSYKMYQFGVSEVIFESPSSQYSTVSIGNEGNMDFLNIGLKELTKGAKITVLAPSHAGYGETVQIVPTFIRRDLFEKGEPIDVMAPYIPLRFEAEIREVD